MRGDQQFRLLEDFPAKDEFLQIAAGQAAGSGLSVRGFHAEALDDRFGEGFDLAALDQAVADQALLEGGKQGVVRQAHVRHRAMPEAFGGDERQTEFASRIRAQIGDSVFSEADG